MFSASKVIFSGLRSGVCSFQYPKLFFSRILVLFLVLLVSTNEGFVFAQTSITIDGNGTTQGGSYTSGTDWTCGSSVIQGTLENDGDYYICLCPSDNGYLRVNLSIVNMENPNGPGNDDYIYVYQGCGTGGGVLYNHTGLDSNELVTSSIPGDCITIRMEERGSHAGGPYGFTATVDCSENCFTDFSNNADDFISNVSFNTIDYTSSGSGGYDDQKNPCTRVLPGDTIQLCVEVTTGGPYEQHIWAYFDFNVDNVFSNGTYQEVYDLGDNGSASGPYTVCQDIAIPSTALGTLTMRIAEKFGSNPPTDGCGPMGSSDGEVEDYCIKIVDCNATTVPNAGADQVLSQCTPSTTLAGNVITEGTGTWSILSGSATIDNPSNPTSGISDLGLGQNIFLWTVTNDPCPALIDTVIIQTQGNATVANAGPDLDACSGQFEMSANAPTQLNETGSWSCAGSLCENLSPNSSTDPNQVFTITGSPVAGETATMTWTLDNGTCTSSDDVLLTIISGVDAANAGADILECVDSVFSLTANTPLNGQGSWSTTTGINIDELTNPSSDAQGISAGSYVLTWTIVGEGCTSSSDDVNVTIQVCDSNIKLDVCTVGSYSFSDGPGNYNNNEHIVRTYCSDADTLPYITISFSLDVFNESDHLSIIDGDMDGANPFIWSSDVDGPPTTPTTITSSNPDGCLTLVFMSNSSGTAAGFEATVQCVSAPGSNTPVCNDSDCQGGCGITICTSGEYSWAGDGYSVPELNESNQGCLDRNEQCNVWYYINPESVPPGGGDLSLNIVSNSGQDQDFAVWEGFGSLDCPVVSKEAPIACNYIANNNTGSGTGFTDSIQDDWHTSSLWISEQDIENEIYYMVLINTFNPGGSCPQTDVTLDFGGSALLSCDPIVLNTTLVDFHGIAYEDHNYLYWETQSERNSAYFTLESSSDLSSWSEVVTIPAAGSSSHNLYYSFEDFDREIPVTYYRLREVDVDGKVTDLKIISVSNLGDKESWITNVFPNPASESITFQFNGNKSAGLLTCYVFDMLGREVMNQELSLSKHEAHSLKTTDLENGHYSILFVQDQKFQWQRFTVMNK